MLKKLLGQLQKPKIQIILVLAITTLVFSNILFNQFVLDDQEFIVQWQQPKNLANFFQFFGPPSTGAVFEGVYRPIRTLFYAVSYLLWGLNPFWYHLQSIFIHLVTTFLVYLIAKKLTKNNNVAFVSSLLFGVHPIHTEAISFATASFDQIGIIFYLLSFYFYTLIHESSKKINYICSILFAFLSYFSSEFAVSLPFLIIMYDLIFTQHQKNILKKRYKLYLIFFSLFIIYLLARIFLGNVLIKGEFLNHNVFYTLITSSKFFIHYFVVLLFPFDLSLIYQIDPFINTKYILISSFMNQPILDIQNISSFLVLGLSLFIAIWSIKKNPLITFLIAWFYITLIPVSNILPISNIFAIRYLYLPSIGFFIFVGYLLTTSFNSQNKLFNLFLPWRIYLVIFLVVIFSFLTFQRNFDWKNNFAFYTKLLQQYPNHYLPYSFLGLYYIADNKLDLAKSYLDKSIKLNPYNPTNYNSLSALHIKQKNYDLAVNDVNQAIKLDPNNYLYYKDLRAVYYLKGDIDKAIDLETDSTKNEPSFYLKLSSQYLKNKQNDNAIRVLNKGLKKLPQDTNLLNNLATIYLSQDDPKSALKYLADAIKITPYDPDLFYNLASVFISQKDYKQAQIYLTQALRLDPSFTQAANLLQKISEPTPTKKP